LVKTLYCGAPFSLYVADSISLFFLKDRVSTEDIVFLHYFFIKIKNKKSIGGKVRISVDTVSFAAHHNAKRPEGRSLDAYNRTD
jgi:hypothetical protein